MLKNYLHRLHLEEAAEAIKEWFYNVFQWLEAFLLARPTTAYSCYIMLELLELISTQYEYFLLPERTPLATTSNYYTKTFIGKYVQCNKYFKLMIIVLYNASTYPFSTDCWLYIRDLKSSKRLKSSQSPINTVPRSTICVTSELLDKISCSTDCNYSVISS